LQKHEKKDHDLEETKKIIIILKTQLEEEKMIEEVVRSQLKEKEENCEKLEAEIVSLRKELEKKIDQLNRILKFGKSTKILDNILSFQRSPFIKTGLGYDEKKKDPRGRCKH
jgi:capsule polysaccharide export protein KpsE/RkpR